MNETSSSQNHFDHLHNPHLYEGRAFHPSFADGKAAGKLLVTATSIVFQAPDKKIVMPLVGLQIKRGGASDRLFFFTNPSLPDVSFYTDKKAILKDEFLQNCQDVSTHIKKISQKKRVSIIVAALVVVCLIFGLSALPRLRKPVVESIVNQIPFSWEEQLGEQVFKTIQARTPLVENAEVKKDLALLTAPLVAAVKKIHGHDYHLKFFIVHDSSVNAFAMPGGYIVIHSGLILRAGSPEEVLGVVAHEIAHVTERHVLEQMVSTLGTYFIINAFVGDVSGVLAILFENSHLILSQKFSRDAEREADERGWNYLTAAGINPQGMIDFFVKLNEKSKNKNVEKMETWLSFLSTHPATNERIASLEKKLLDLDPKKSFIRFEIDFNLFKKNLEASLPQ